MEKRITLSTTLLLAIRTGNKDLKNTVTANKTKAGYTKVDAVAASGKGIQLSKVETLAY